MLLSFRQWVIFALSAFAVPSSAQSYDVADDFSLAANPNGVWRYGYATSLTAPFSLYSTSGLFTYTENNNQVTLGAWKTSFDPNLGVFKNAGAPYNGTTSYALNEFALHPGRHSEYSQAVWTAPSAGIYQLDAAFRLDSVGQTDVHLFIADQQVLNAVLSGKGKSAAYHSTALSFAAGDAIVFEVGDGGNGYAFDTTGLSAHISAVPEPAALTLFIAAGMTGTAFLRRRRR